MSSFNGNSEGEEHSGSDLEEQVVEESKTTNRGRKRKHGSDENSTRTTPRRQTRGNRKSYVEDNYLELDEERADDPDFCVELSDDPDFAPQSANNDDDIPARRPRMKGKAKGNTRAKRRKSNPPVTLDGPEPETTSVETVNGEDNEKTKEVQEVKTNNETIKLASPQKLSSAYNYAATRQRQNAAIRLPEGPNLTDEQLKQVESQFKSGDFVMAKKDVDVMDHPPIWRIDGKSLLQKFQAFDKDGKMLYRNISTYSGWTPQAKALYVPVKVNFVFQSRYDTVVELSGIKDPEKDEANAVTTAPVAEKPSSWLLKAKTFEISDELRMHMPSFEIYLQTLISQGLDNNFLREVYEENDTYFVERVQVIDDLTNQRKEKILKMTEWGEPFLKALNSWPSLNTMKSTVVGKCKACNKKDADKLSQFYGQPYDPKILLSLEITPEDLGLKNFETCEVCAELSELYNKVCHQKYDYYTQCKSTVTNMRVMQPNKTTTNVLRDLLANDEWITGLFKSMCTTWLKADNAYDEFEKKKKEGDPKESVEEATEEKADDEEQNNDKNDEVSAAEDIVEDKTDEVSAAEDNVEDKTDEVSAAEDNVEDKTNAEDTEENTKPEPTEEFVEES